MPRLLPDALCGFQFSVFGRGLRSPVAVSRTTVSPELNASFCFVSFFLSTGERTATPHTLPEAVVESSQAETFNFLRGDGTAGVANRTPSQASGRSDENPALPSDSSIPRKSSLEFPVHDEVKSPSLLCKQTSGKQC